MRFEPGRGGALRSGGLVHGLKRAQIDEQCCHTGQMAVGQLIRLMHTGAVSHEHEAAPHEHQRAQRPQQQMPGQRVADRAPGGTGSGTRRCRHKVSCGMK